MPLPLAAFAPPAAATCYTGAAAAAKHLALHASPFLDLTTLSSASFAAVLLRYYWKNKVPAWAKEDISFQTLLRKKRKKSKGDEQTDEIEVLSASEREEREMANLASVLEKLQALVESVQVNDDDRPSTLQLHAALLAYIQLSAQIKRQEEQGGGIIQHIDSSEEKKTGEQQEITDGPWSSRDSLYRSARPSEATSSNVLPEYYSFAENPSESPVRHTLQQALAFATWAYYDDTEILSERLAAEDFSLLKHSIESRPGHVAYYLAVSSVAKKQLIIGIRGTSTLEDMCTDCCGRPVVFDDRPYYYEHDRGTKRNAESNNHDPAIIEVKAAAPPEIIADNEEDHVEVISGHERIWVEEHDSDIFETLPCQDNDHLLRCHEGIMVSAKRLVDALQGQIEHWVLQRGYQLVINGHSLGAGAASLAAVILRSRLPELMTGPQKMQVFAFAPPPVLDHRTAMAASSYCTSIVNNADIIPRCSLANLLILLEILREIQEKLQEQQLAPTGPKSMAAFVKKIAQGLDGDLLMTAEELRNVMRRAMVQVKANNYRTRKATTAKEEQGEGFGSCCICAGSSRGASATASMDDIETEDDENQSESTPEELCTTASIVPLYIPGVVLLANESWQSYAAEDGQNVGNGQIEQANDDQTETSKTQKDPKVEWNVTDGTADVLHFLEFDNFTLRMLTDHITTSYYTLVDMEYDF